jgi:hypothetical protein
LHAVVAGRSRRVPRMLRKRPSTEATIARSSARDREPDPALNILTPESRPEQSVIPRVIRASSTLTPPSTSSWMASSESSAWPAYPECRPPQASEFLSPKPKTGRTSAGRTPATTTRCRPPETRSEAEQMAGRHPGIGSPHQSRGPRRPETLAHHTIRPRVGVSRSRALYGQFWYKARWLQSFGSRRSEPSRVVGDHFM